MKFLTNFCTNAHWNMAFDEFALEGIHAPEPLFFLWQNAPAVIIGLNQSPYAEVNLPYLEQKGILLARRVTGGGAVYHDLGNLNYSIAGPLEQMENAYEWVPEALRRMGVPAERSGRNDILVDGKKCSGYAKRLSKDRMMIHGTLLWNVNLEVLTQALQVPGSKLQAAGIASVHSRVVNLKEYLPQFCRIQEFQAALQDILAEGDPMITLSQEQLRSIDQMADEKFRRWEWIYGHSPSASFQSSRKFACGTIQVQYTLKHGVFESLSFSGDFLGNRPAEELARQLIGKRVEDIGALPVSLYFDQLTAEEFLTLFE